MNCRLIGKSVDFKIYYRACPTASYYSVFSMF